MTDNAFLLDLATRYGTPLYAYDLSTVRSTAAALRGDLPAGSRILYSVKANPHPVLVETLRTEGCEAEVSSVGELAVAIAAGHAPERVLYSGPGKSASDLRTALASGVRTFSVESVTDRQRLDALAHDVGVRCDYLVRLNGPAGSVHGSLRMSGSASAFGADVADAEALRALLTVRSRTRPIGLHTFFATNVGSEDSLIAEFQQAVRTVSEVCRETAFVPHMIDLGGGFPAPQAAPGGVTRHPRLASAVESALDTHLVTWRTSGVEIAFESGRYLVGAAGTLITEVLDVKHSRGRTFTVLDTGVNALGGMSGLGRLMAPQARPYRLDRAPTRNVPSDDDPCPVTLVGPLCTPLDVLNRSVDLGEVRVGDLLAVPNVGAYGLTASLVGFLSHPLPTEIVHAGGTVVSARRLALQEVHL
ncbi:type III PLP-dependent enzyme [Streptomyces aurantiacus]|uniref:Putative Diaminopimelate decarboxylase n=1 Tax=Streptomyces aurantiacus JA 4570 TaxID=1286094 RepID=S3ZQY9_9ACTN|nr:diaminopimelate decarboxylase [Streptomyces aurantiacus]EPH45229.1 putative Diaminopimelate decarboxylase [Streptomyces aurantiacus JA 4570]